MFWSVRVKQKSGIEWFKDFMRLLLSRVDAERLLQEVVVRENRFWLGLECSCGFGKYWKDLVYFSSPANTTCWRMYVVSDGRRNVGYLIGLGLEKQVICKTGGKGWDRASEIVKIKYLVAPHKQKIVDKKCSFFCPFLHVENICFLLLYWKSLWL